MTENTPDAAESARQAVFANAEARSRLGVDHTSAFTIALWGARAMQAAMPAPAGVRVPTFPRYGHLPAREFLLLASYCGGDNDECTDARPCADCLAMCNVYAEDSQFLRSLGANPAKKAGVPAPLYKRVEAILDEHSAWIARPNDEVTKRVALAAMFAAHSVLIEEDAPEERYLRDGAAPTLSAIEDAGAREGAEGPALNLHDAYARERAAKDVPPDPTPAGAGDLVERLREPGRRYFDGIDYQEGTRPNRDGEEAANTIEVLQAMAEPEPVASLTELTVLIENLLAIKNPTPRIPNVARLLLKRSLIRIEALEAEVEGLRESQWREDEPRKDGVPFLGMDVYTMRWTPYSKKSEQYKRGWAGRWQRAGEHGGWDNCPTPQAWKPDPQYARAAPAKAGG